MAMKPHRKKKLIGIITGLMGVSIVVALVLFASEQKMNYFFTPSEIAQGMAPTDKIIRIGGLVKLGSVENIEREDSQLETRFVVTDNHLEIKVIYHKLLPDLFREGQGVVAMGKINQQREFIASEVLAKHDEEYKAPEVLDALERAGHPVKREQ